MGFLKDVATAFKPANIKRGLDASRGPVDQAAIDASVEALTPEQRAAYDANMAKVEEGRAQSRAAWEEARELEDRIRVLYGPAGRYLHGPSLEDVGSPDEIDARVGEVGALAVVQQMRAVNKGQFKMGLRQALGRHEVDQIDDPVRREQVAAEERAARDAARAPYRAADAVPLAFTRIPTRGETQLAELLAYLEQSGLAAYPERVFGVYRVPDRISQALTPHSERGRLVEWDVVHEPGAGGTAAPRPEATSFVAKEQWVARRLGEPSILDEDLALAFCREAGIGPERCLGLARVSEFRTIRGHGSGEDGGGEIRTLVQGVVAIHPEAGSGAFEQMLAAAPLDLPREPEGVHVEVLNWEHVGNAVHLKVHHPPPVPSPFPYLPATPQELLEAYLEVVGVRAADCYSAQATVDHPRPLMQGGLFSTNLGPKQPCADGKDRMRTRGCEHVVVAYRDRPEYAAGRDRWATYQAEVLEARLQNAVRKRSTLKDDDITSGWPKPLRAAVRAAELIDRIDEIGTESVPPYRYCWPPVA
jgi:hypothetical protein